MNRVSLLHKIGAPLPENKMVVEDQDAFDIIHRMMIKHKRCACDYDKIADEFEGRDIYETAQLLWNFCKKNLAYREETINEQNVSSPQTILRRGHCDCKGYALFIGGILDALNRKGWNIKWRYRFASDDIFNEIPGHVFIVINDSGQEIWVDPVLNEFNAEHYFPYYQDKKVSVKPAAMAGCGCGDAVGATTAQTGAQIVKIAPVLATVPVVGWIASAAAEIVGGLFIIFGDKFIQGPDIRWLIQEFENLVKGIASATSDNTIQSESDAEKQSAWAWFSVVCGVPVYAISAFNCLSTGHEQGKYTGLDPAGRAGVYVRITGNPANVPLATLAAAATIAANMDAMAGITATSNGRVPSAKTRPGIWAGLTPAPWLIGPADPVKAAAQSGNSTMAVDQYGNLVTPPVKNNFILLAAVAAIALILIK